MKGLGACLTIVALVFAANFTFGCGSMEETSPGVFEGTGKYEGKVYREAAPGESADATAVTKTDKRFARFDGGYEITRYVELTPSEQAVLQNEGTEPPAAQAQVSKPAGPPPPPPHVPRFAQSPEAQD